MPVISFSIPKYIQEQFKRLVLLSGLGQSEFFRQLIEKEVDKDRYKEGGDSD